MSLGVWDVSLLMCVLGSWNKVRMSYYQRWNLLFWMLCYVPELFECA